MPECTLFLCAPRRGNENIAQGNALGANGNSNFRPERAKAFENNAFALSGREMMMYPNIPRAMPWAMFFWPFRLRNDDAPEYTQGVALGYVLLAFQAVK